MKVEVNHDACIGCGACMNIADNFDFDSEGYVSVVNETVTEKTKEAKECCPVGAISIVEE